MCTEISILQILINKMETMKINFNDNSEEYREFIRIIRNVEILYEGHNLMILNLIWDMNPVKKNQVPVAQHTMLLIYNLPDEGIGI